MMPSLSELQTTHRGQLIFECVAGSRAYGTSNQDSDEDLRGVLVLPARDYLGLVPPPNQVADERQNQIYFSLRRTIELLAVGNPNILELLYMPADCVRLLAPEMIALIAARTLFITRECAENHIGYAFSQIKKARGQNKWINNPMPREAPTKEAFCYVIPVSPPAPGAAPMRPKPLTQLGWNLDEYHAARLEQARDVYRLYHYGASGRGVFRNESLALEPIPLEDENPRYAGLLIFREQAWRQACEDHRNYWTWRSERNESRWQQQERGELDYDAKNLMHTLRLLMSGRSILQRREPIIRFEGDALDTLRRVRAGALTYDEIMTMAQDIAAECESLKDSADLPSRCDVAQADRLLHEITAAWERRQHG